jgi:hypothetical protein
LNKSVNAIRNRPIEARHLRKRSLTKTAALQIAALPVDPSRDTDVPALIWEIRRERRMEFVYENFRLLDIKRWKKLNYMNFSVGSDYFLGPWVNLQVEPLNDTYLTTANINTVKVQKGRWYCCNLEWKQCRSNGWFLGESRVQRTEMHLQINHIYRLLGKLRLPNTPKKDIN